jgi:tetratricopeptide (TPR) repeat protein
LSEACPILAEKLNCLYWRVMLAGRLREIVELDTAAADYLNEKCVDAIHCAEGASWLGTTFASFGQHAKALQMYERAARETGTGPAWRAVADAAERLGLPAEANRARQRADRLEGKREGAATRQLENLPGPKPDGLQGGSP